MTIQNKEITNKFNAIVSQLSYYEPRKEQIAMVNRVQEAFDKTESLVIEAGTGAGKSFGYLYPVVMSNLKVVISTGTIALQEQLLTKDIPFIVNHSGKELKYVLVKGRGNYICLQKFFETIRTLATNSKEYGITKKIESRLLNGWSGDIADLDFIVPNLIWMELNSDKDDCLNHRCEHFSRCHFRIARKELADADIMISNHALYFTDLASGGTILPHHDYVIFDEAHHIKGTATNAFTANIGKWASTRLMQKIQKRLTYVPDNISSNITSIETEILSWLLAKKKANFRIFADSNFFDLVGDEIYHLKQLRSWLNDLEIEQLQLFSDDSKLKKLSHKDRLVAQTSNLISRWEYFAEQDQQDEESLRVNWAEVKKEKLSFEINSAPIFVSQILKKNLWDNVPAVLTSATLSVNRSCNYTKDQLGLTAKELILDSPFDYTTQAGLYIPRIAEDPNSDSYNSTIAREITEIVTISQGRSLVLFTSINSMKNVTAFVSEQVEYPCKMQGDLPRSKLIEWFKNTPNSILFATATFWEGIDIPGEDLICVIIDKIPFTNPDDPVVSATVDQMKAKNQSWFMEYMLPEATLRLKQGFGRLIRTKNDYGLVCLLDPRLLGKSYGQTILGSLPRAPIINSIEEVKEFFDIINSYNQS